MSSPTVRASAQWITHPAWVDPGPEVTRAPVLRRDVTITEAPMRAELVLTGLGVWTATLDGLPLDDAQLEPGTTDFGVRVAVTAIDLTERLTPGTHRLEVTLGEGSAHVREAPGRYTKFVGARSAPRLIAELTWTTGSGAVQSMITDPRWETALSGTTRTHWYGGEDHDARIVAGPWIPAVSVGDRDRGPVLWRREAPPVRVVDRWRPRERTRLDDRSVMIDFGENHAGRPVIMVPDGVPAGRTIELWPAEDLGADDHVDQTSTGTPIVDVYTTADGAATWHPRFCYHGYRYVELRGTAPLDLVQVESEVLRSDNPRTGWFSCSSEDLSQVHRLTDRAVQSNLFSVLTDCPHREKLGWLEQLHLVFPALVQHYDVRPQLTDMITHLADAQTADGLVPDIAPELTIFPGGFRDDVNWGSAVVQLPYLLWRTHGDLAPARAAWPAIEKYVSHLDGRLEDGLLPAGLADWKALGPRTPATLVHGHGYLAMMQSITELAPQVGQDPAPYLDRRARMADRLRAAHVGADGTVEGGGQAAYALALDAGLVPAELVPTALDLLLHTIRTDDHAMTVGEIGLPALFRVLTAHGRHHDLLELVTQRRHPGYGHMISSGCSALARDLGGRPG